MTMPLRIGELYAEKANRDTRYRELKAQGLKLKRYTVRNQQLHPQYVEDRKDTLAGRDRGFGNTAYQTMFGVLYGVKTIEEGR